MTIDQETLGRALGISIIALGTLLLVYAVLAFAALEANPLEWPALLRLSWMLMWAWFLARIPRRGN